MITVQETTRRRQARRIRWKAGVSSDHTSCAIAGLAFGEGRK